MNIGHKIDFTRFIRLNNKLVVSVLCVLVILILWLNASIFIYLRSQSFTLGGIYGQKRLEDSDSWKLDFEQFESLREYDKRIRYGSKISIPEFEPLEQSKKIIDLHDDYLFMVPMSKYEDIDFFKNFYSDLNTLVICDADDQRDGCDVNLDLNYNYHTLKEKTHDIFRKYCNYGKFHKVVAKMDFDAIMDKRHLYKVVKFMADNSDKRMYYGNPFFKPTGVAMGGNFYALSEQLMRDYCSCETPLLDTYAEDLWFGRTINTCVRSKNLPKHMQINYIFNNQTKILHKTLRKNGVHLRLGKEVVQDS